MRKYQVKIDDAISTQAFSLDELLEAGLLDDYDENIMVRATGESKWIIARNYPFATAERNQSNNRYTINPDGSVTRQKKSSISSCNPTSNGYRIDEYGQVVRREDCRPSRLDLSTDSLHFTSSNGSRTINVTSNGSWDISLSPASWVHLSKNGSSLDVRVDTNCSSNYRSDYFKLKSGDKEKRVDIYQSAGSLCSSSSSSSSADDNNGCWWTIAFIIAFFILRAIFG